MSIFNTLIGFRQKIEKALRNGLDHRSDAVLQKVQEMSPCEVIGLRDAWHIEEGTREKTHRRIVNAHGAIRAVEYGSDTQTATGFVRLTHAHFCFQKGEHR